jgi:hypothetical protein
VDYVSGGGGFGDPLDRDPEAVLTDHGRGWVSLKAAESLYGVVLGRDKKSVDAAATDQRREELRRERLREGAPPSGKTSSTAKAPSTPAWRSPSTATSNSSAARAAAIFSAAPGKTISYTPPGG